MLYSALEQRLGEIGPRFGIRLALVFGSAVSGLQHERSDLDLALVLDDPKLDLFRHADLHHELQASLPGRELDLAIINHADPLFLHQVTAACRLVYGDPRALERLKLFAFRRYQDHRRFLELERACVRRFIETFEAA
jgi:predicted nucleotidyltransferase